MTDATPHTLHEAARHLGVSARVLRQAIRGGHLAAPPAHGATTALPPGWVDAAQAALKAAPSHAGWRHRQKVAPFARYQGTSAWRKYRVRVRAYARFLKGADHPAA